VDCTILKHFLSTEQIVVATGSLKVRLIVGLRPNKQPVASVCDMAFHASRPLAFEPMHIMPANKF